MNGFSIIVSNLSVKLQGNCVLDGISFQLLPNQHLAIVGHSGSGKTTLAKALAGRVFHQGTVRIETSSAIHPHIIYVAQHNQFKSLSNQSSFYYQQRFNSTESEDALTLEEELKRIVENLYDTEEATEIINQWLAHFKIEHRRNTPLLQLSNGEHKRLQLIKALLQQPQVLILDQPFIGLDVTTREDLHNVINHLSKETKIILITGANEIPACVTHVAQLEKGKLKAFVEKNSFKGEENATHFFAAKAFPKAPETTSFNTAVKMVNTTVKYGEKTILSNINWQVNAGERWLVKGPNGAGKSTLLSLLTGDNPQAYANEIYLFDRRRGSGESIWDIKQKIGFVSPELHWYFDKGITIAQTIASGFFDTVGLYRQLTKNQENILQEWISFFHLTGVQNRLLAILSAGQQRLVLLARALVKNPPLLILDEPCQGLDEVQTTDFRLLIDELCRELNKTLIYVSHYEQEVPSCVDHQLALNNGVATITTIERKKLEAA